MIQNINLVKSSSEPNRVCALHWNSMLLYFV